MCPMILMFKHTWPQNGRFSRHIRVRLWFPPEAQTAAYDSQPFWETMEEGEDGSVVVTFIVPEFDWAVSTVLSFNGRALVLEPDELRRRIAEQAREIAEQYK